MWDKTPSLYPRLDSDELILYCPSRPSIHYYWIRYYEFLTGNEQILKFSQAFSHSESGLASVCFFPEALDNWLGSLVKRSQSVVMVVLWCSSEYVWWLDCMFPLTKQLHWSRRAIGLPVIIDVLSNGDYIMKAKNSFWGSFPGLPAEPSSHNTTRNM